MGNGVCAGCKFDKVSKTLDEKHLSSMCTNPKNGYARTGLIEIGISTDNNFESCDNKER